MNRANSLIALFIALAIMNETVYTVQFLPSLVHRRSVGHLDHHKLIKEINELEYSPSRSTSGPPSETPSTKLDSQATIVAKKLPSKKRKFSLDEFTLDDVFSQNGLPIMSVLPTLGGDGETGAQTRSTNTCSKTRVAAGASGYLRLTCLDMTPAKLTAQTVSLEPRLNSLLQMENAQFRRMNSNFEQLVDALRSGSGHNLPSSGM